MRNRVASSTVYPDKRYSEGTLFNTLCFSPSKNRVVVVSLLETMNKPKRFLYLIVFRNFSTMGSFSITPKILLSENLQIKQNQVLVQHPTLL